MVINDLFFIFFGQNSDRTRTAVGQKQPKNALFRHVNKGIEGVPPFASSRLWGKSRRHKGLETSTLSHSVRWSDTFHSDRTRTVLFSGTFENY